MTIKNLELTVVDYKKKEMALETKMRQMKYSFDAISSDRNLLSKNLLIANVSHATSPFSSLVSCQIKSNQIIYLDKQIQKNVDKMSNKKA